MKFIILFIEHQEILFNRFSNLLASNFHSFMQRLTGLTTYVYNVFHVY